MVKYSFNEKWHIRDKDILEPLGIYGIHYTTIQKSINRLPINKYFRNYIFYKNDKSINAI